MSPLNFFGDVHLEKPARSNVPLEGEYVCNLESPVTRSARPVWGKINLKAGGIFFKETFGRNPVAVCLANNHIMDYGEEGLLDTLTTLRAEGIRYFGAGSLADRCRNPLLLDLDGQRIALLGYVCPTTHAIFAAGENHGVAPIDPEAIAGDILTAKGNGAERIIVQLHWGEEDVGLPRPADVARAHGIIDLGADLIIGHHAHCIQPFEVFKGRHIFYGLGNAVFPDTEMVSFSRDGRRKDNRQMRWGRRNRTSLTVLYDTVSGRVAMRRLYFKDALDVVVGARPERDLSHKAATAGRYDKRYVRELRMSMLQRLAVSFFSRPRLPKKSNLRWLLERFKAEK